MNSSKDKYVGVWLRKRLGMTPTIALLLRGLPAWRCQKESASLRDFFFALVKPNDVVQLSWLDWRRVEESRFRVGQAYSLDETQHPHQETHVLDFARDRVFDPVCLRQPE